MTEVHLPDVPEAEHEGLIKTPKQLILAVFFAFAVPIVGIGLLANLVSSERRLSAGSDALQPAAIAERIQPVGRVEINPAGDAEEAAAAVAAASTAPAAGASAAAGTGAVTATAQAAMTAALASATPAAPAAAKSDAGAVPALYTQTCFVCHGTGAAGAPKLGDKAAWAPRLKLGIDGLTATAIKGIGAMPPRGGSSASDADIKAVVTYMVHAAQ